MTSFDVIRILRKKFNIKKIGHAGTLDPLASWLLLVAVWDYTKLLHYLGGFDKKYHFSVCLDGTSASFDLGTTVEHISPEKMKYFEENISLEDIKKLIEKRFLWEHFQVPPKYSALKIGGKKALEKVRDGEDFEMKTRKIFIYEMNILNFSYPLLELEAKVSTGSYVRSIARDIGEALWTWGYVSALERTQIGEGLFFDMKKNLDTLDENDSLKEEEVFGKERIIKLDPDIIEKLDHGMQVKYETTELEKNIPYFVKNTDFISNVIEFDGQYIIPLRKIGAFL
jgi:tRNA pseudouridine55 synthase